MALSPDRRRESFGETISPTMVSALEELRPYGIPSGCQGFVEWKPEGLRLPIIGYFDFHWEQHNIMVQRRDRPADRRRKGGRRNRHQKRSQSDLAEDPTTS